MASTREARRLADARPRAASWRVAASGALALGGLGVSAYLTAAHYVGAEVLVCSGSGAINCEKVTTSPQSVIVGVPVAVLGLAFYVVMTALCSPWAWRSARRELHATRLALCFVGIAFVLYLVAAELLEIKAICIWCTAVHVVTFAQLVLVVATVPALLGWGQQRASAEVAPARRSDTTGPKPRRGRPRVAQGRAR
ncbi:MAG: vitamin K epoxide reductase family protein [Acidimicrobiales bacterium]